MSYSSGSSLTTAGIFITIMALIIIVILILLDSLGQLAVPSINDPYGRCI